MIVRARVPGCFRLWPILVLAVAVVAAAAAAAPLTAAEPLPTGTATVDITAAKAGLQAILDLQLAGSKASDTYDPNAFLAVFSHLSLEDGYTLDYVPNDWQGMPWVYARTADGETFSDQRSVRAAHPEAKELGTMARFAPAFLQRLRTDGSAEGFLELALIVVQMRQFRLMGHANQLNLTIVPGPEEIERIIANKWLQPEKVDRARKLDVTPTVAVTADAVEVRYVVFTQEGFEEIRWTVTRSIPHRVTGASQTLLLKDRPTIKY